MRYIFYIALIIIFAACEKETTKILPESNFTDIIIDAFITDEYKAQKIILSIPGLNQNDSLIPVSGATIYIKEANSIYYFTESDSLKGHYFSNVSFSPVIGKSYYLDVSYKQKHYYANTYMLPVKHLEPLIYDLNTDLDLYKITWVTNIYNPQEQAMYEVNITPNSVTDSLNIRAFYYSFNTLDVSQVFAQEPADIYFSHGSKMVESKYSLTPEYAKYIRALASETMWQGGLLSETPNNLPSNIKGGALGYFSTCAVIRKEIIVP